VEKRCNLILNVDGMVAVMLLDLFENLGLSFEERVEYIEA
jgi:hypothetical protein